MNTWGWMLIASGLCLMMKVAGMVVPVGVLQRPALAQVVANIPIALLGGLIALDSATQGRAIEVDARLAGVATAGVLLWLRAPFIVVVVGAAAGTAILRLVTQ